MALLHTIQTALLEGGDLSNALLKMRVLAARLNSGELADWIGYESEGYPTAVEVPEYRKISIVHLGEFSGPFNSGIKNAVIPAYLIKTHIGDDALTLKVRESISGVQKLAEAATRDGGLRLAFSNYPLLLQGHVYPGYSCVDVKGVTTGPAMEEIITVVRSKLLDLTLRIESQIPEASQVEIASIALKGKTQEVSNIMSKIVYGNVNTIHNSGNHSNFTVTITQGDNGGVVRSLTEAGISEEDAKAFTKIVAAEKPTSADDPLGENAKGLIVANIHKAVSGAWKVGLPVATNLLTEAAKQYYGFH